MERRSHRIRNYFYGSMRKKFAILLLFVAFVPPAFVIQIGYTNVKNHMKRYRIEVLESIADLKIREIESFFREKESDILTAQDFINIKINLPVLAQYANDRKNLSYIAVKQEVDKQLKPFQEVFGFMDVMLTNTDGKIVYVSNEMKKVSSLDSLLSYIDDKSFEKGKKSIYFSEVLSNKHEENSNRMLLCAPIYGFDKEYMGVIALEIDMNPLFTSIRSVSGLGKTGETLVGKRDGDKVVFLNLLRHSSDIALRNFVSVNSEHSIPIIRGASGQSGIMEATDYRKANVIAVYRYIPICNWGFVSKIDIDEELEAVFALKRQLAYLGTGFIVAILLLSYFAALKITKPLKDMVTAAKRITEGDFDVKVRTGHSRDELDMLGYAFNSMVSRIKEFYNNMEQKVAERTRELQTVDGKLRKSENSIRVILDNTVDGIITIDEKGIVGSFNKAAEQIFAYSASEVVGNNVKMLQPEPYRSNHDKYLENYLVTGTKKVIGVGREVTGLRKNGVAFPLELSVSEVIVDEKRIFTGIIRDITDRKAAENQLEERAKLLALGSDIGKILAESDDLNSMLKCCVEAVVQHLDAAFSRIWILNEEDQVLELMASAGMYTHIDGGHARVPVGKFKIGLIAEEREPHLTNDVQNDPRVSNKDWARREGMVAFVGYPLIVEQKLIGVIAMFSQSKLPDSMMDALGSISTQIALGVNRKQTEKDLIKAKDVAEAATNAKSSFLASMSHEIRTPMNAIVGMAELLDETELTDEQKSYIKIFRNAGQNLLGVINDILDFSKIESGHLKLEKTVFDLGRVLDNVSDMMAFRLQEKGLEFVISLPPDIPIGIIGDPVRLYQVLVNLVGNAVKFTERGEIAVSVERKHNDVINDYKDKNEVVLTFSVRDTGIGIQKEKLDTIFQSFSQADTSTTRKYGGTGLGLSISQRIVSLMGGEIHVESKEGKGSLFSFAVKFEIDQDYQKEQEIREIDLKGIRVLIVDDNMTNRMVLMRTLSGWGAKAEEASNGNECISVLKKAKESGNVFKLVLLDYEMPGMDGLEVAKRIKNDSDLNTTIILLTSYDFASITSLNANGLGLSGYMTKPIKRSQLRTSIKTALGMPEVLDIKSSIKAQPLHTGESKRILLVEDNEDNKNLILAYLKKTSHIIDTAENGEVAVEKFISGKYDLVLMDIEMPVMDGYSATKAIREWEKIHSIGSTPVIALTAHAMKEHMQMCLDAGCNGYITKPVRKAKIIETINKFKGES